MRTCGRAEVRRCGGAEVRTCGRADVLTCGREHGPQHVQRFTNASPHAHTPHLRTSAPPHLRTSTRPHVHTSAPPHVRTSTRPHVHTSTRPHVHTSTRPHLRAHFAVRAIACHTTRARVHALLADACALAHNQIAHRVKIFLTRIFDGNRRGASPVSSQRFRLRMSLVGCSRRLPLGGGRTTGRAMAVHDVVECGEKWCGGEGL